MATDKALIVNDTATVTETANNVMKKLTDLTSAAGNAFSTLPVKEGLVRAARYSAAAVEYLGLASSEFIKAHEPDVRQFIKAAGEKLDEYHVGPKSIAEALRKIYKQEFDELKRLTSEVAALQAGSREAVSLTKIEELSARLNRIEERLIYIERHGITIAKEAAVATGLRQLNKEKLGLLRQLVEINKELRA